MARSSPLTPMVVLAGALLLTLVATVLVGVTMRARDAARFENAVQGAEDRVESRAELYIALLRATAGFFAASEEVHAAEFHAYAGRVSLRQRYPGIQGIGFSPRVAPGERAAVEAWRVREGQPGFHLWPEAGQGEAFPVVFIDPPDRRNQAALGFDMFSEPTRREAMGRARDTGLPALSGAVTLKQEIDEEKQAGFLLYVPVYAGGRVPGLLEERRELLTGFVFAAFRADDLFAGLFGTETAPRVDVAVFDGLEARPERLLHGRPRQEGGWFDGSARFTETRQLQVAGRTWTLVLTSTPYFESLSSPMAAVATGLVGLFMSLTLFAITRAQARAQGEAERALALLDAFFEAAPLGFVVLDRELRHVRVNARVVADTDLESPAQLLGRTMREVLSPEAADRMEPLLREVMRTGAPVVNLEVSGGSARRPWDVRHYLLSFYPVRTRTGEVHGVCSISVEVTGLKRAEAVQALLLEVGGLLSESLDLETTLRAIPRLAVTHLCDFCTLDLLDESGQPRRVQAQARRPEQEAIVQGLLRFPPLLDGSSPLSQVLRTGEPLLLRLTPEVIGLLARSPEHRGLIEALSPAASAMVPLKARGRTLGVLNMGWTTGSRPPPTGEDLEVAKGVADRAAIALDNARLYETLEAQVAERTAQLLEANAELEAFSYSVSHDLRTPLRGVEGFAQAAEDDPDSQLSERARGYLARVRSASARMAQLIDDLLRLSRISRHELTRAPVDVSALARAAGAELAARESGRTVHLSVQEGMQAHADARLLRIVFENLLGNAWKFTSRRQEAQVSVTAALGPEGETVFRVEDDGTGFDMAHAQRLFTPFQRLHSAAEFPGTGIGLATVQRIVRRHGGRLWAESQPDVGTRFFFTLGP